jgi:hypothetical protein
MITKGVKMNYLEINGERFGSNDLIDFVTTRLTELGVNSFQAIHIDAKKNHINIQFDETADANIASAIAGLPQQNNNKQFETKDARHFMLALFETSVQAGFS